MYKSQLQEYAQKAGLMHPTYDHVKEGASHEPRFKSTVWVNNQSYESAPGFPTLRSAEHAAAKVALDFLQKSQISGVVPSPVHESGLCKNLLQEFAQKNGYALPQYKIMRQGEEHSLVFTATVEIAGVSYSGGGAKSKKEAEIKAARTALLAIQASQPGMGLPAVEPRPLVQSQPGLITNFVKSHPKRKKRGRANSQLIEEPLATRMKQSLEQVGGPVQLPQMHQVHQMHQIPQVSQVSQHPHILHVQPINQLPQTFPVNTLGYSGQSVIPVEWNHELGVCTRPAVVNSEPMQVGNYVPQDTAMSESDWGPRLAVALGTEPTLDANFVKAENHPTTAVGNSETTVFEAQMTTTKAEFGIVQQVPLTTEITEDSQVPNAIPTENMNFVSSDHTESLATTVKKETVIVTEVSVPSVSTSEALSIQPQFSTPVKEELTASQVVQAPVPMAEITTKNSVSDGPHDSVGAQEVLTFANGELQAEILRAMNVEIKSVSSEAA